MYLYKIFFIAISVLGLSTNLFAATLSSDKNQTVQVSNQEAKKVVKLDINKASMEDLRKLKGLNTAKAKGIIAYRAINNFKSLDELKNVKGFKRVRPVKLKEIQDQLMVNP